MSVKVSIVVPIYNVEKYLPKCVESLMSQNLKEVEIILVDDGSPDNSGQLAEDYAKRDNRIKVIHQKNTGLGPARNSGIDAATGEYVGFVDSDDWVNMEMYSCLYKCALRTKADIVFGGHRDMTRGVAKVIKSHPLAGKVLNKDEIISIRKNLFGHAIGEAVVEAFPMQVWTGIYRRKMILDNKLRFEEIQSEDTIFNLDAYKCAQIISYIGNTDYCYRKDNQPSIMKTFSDEKHLRYIAFLDRIYEKALEENDEECVMRTKRMSIDYSRLFVGIVADSGLSFRKKKMAIQTYAQNENVQKYWSGYPVRSLPKQQRVFQELLKNKKYGSVILLSKIRAMIK